MSAELKVPDHFAPDWEPDYTKLSDYHDDEKSLDPLRDQPFSIQGWKERVERKEFERGRR